MAKRMRWIGLTVLTGLMVITAEGAGWAACDTCQVCRERTHITIPADYCSPASGENGSLCCSEFNSGAGTYCGEYGSACYGIIIHGGGGSGGSGGGGGGCTYQGGWCPAECMSCSGGGGGVFAT
jgi:hypothetical protein